MTPKETKALRKGDLLTLKEKYGEVPAGIIVSFEEISNNRVGGDGYLIKVSVMDESITTGLGRNCFEAFDHRFERYERIEISSEENWFKQAGQW